MSAASWVMRQLQEENLQLKKLVAVLSIDKAILQDVLAKMVRLRGSDFQVHSAASDRIVEAPAPSHPIDRGIAGPGLLAWVQTSKYCEHTPLYRQTKILARQGVDLSRALLSNWVDTC